MSESIVGIDDTLTHVVGCDPGPEHCAFARVLRLPDSRLAVVAAAYPSYRELIDGGARVLGELFPKGGFAFCYEKVTSRYGACPGATTYDTCRNSGLALRWAVDNGADRAYGLGTVDWRVALGGRTNLSDAEVRAELVRVLGPEQDKAVAGMAKSLKQQYKLEKPIGCHLRDAVGVAVGAFMMKRHGVPASEREVWHGRTAEA